MSTINIEKRQEPERRLAELVAELVRQGVVFHVYDRSTTYEVELTGGH